METERFTSDIKYKMVELWCPSDVVQHSFIVQNSISHLDLEVSQLYRFWTSFLGPYPKYSPYSVINTEEKCQKFHSRSRSLLYNLHLDLPKAREWSLKSESLPKNLDLYTDQPCLARIEIRTGFYIDILRDFIQRACINADLNAKVLKWFMKIDKMWRCDFSDRCFSHPSFMCVGEVLKFLDAPHLCGRFVDLFEKEIWFITHYLPVRLLMRTLRLKSVRRCALLLHLYWTYLKKTRNPSAASESLRLVWNAVHDSFITCNEITAEFARLGSKEIYGIYDFYSKAVGEYHEDARARTLKHLCRSTIRYQLWRSEQWLPEGIERIGLPRSLQSYLKLEM